MAKGANLKAAYLSKQKKYSKTHQCMYVDANGRKCGANSIASHTLQKSGALGRIAEDGQLYKLKLNLFASTFNDTLDFRKIGKSKASIFPGFCNRHDTSVFAEVEAGDVEVTQRSLLLLTYRVICLEIFQKEINVKIYSDPVFQAEAEFANFSNQFIKGSKDGLRDLGRMKLAYEAAIHHSIGLENFGSFVFGFDEPLPFCFAAPIVPERDFNGDIIQPQAHEIWDSVGIYAGALGNKNIFAVAGFLDSEKPYLREFVCSFDNIPLREAGDIALNTGIDFVENSFFQRSWIDKLEPVVKAQLISRFATSTPNADVRRGPEMFRSNSTLNRYAAWKKLSLPI